MPEIPPFTLDELKQVISAHRSVAPIITAGIHSGIVITLDWLVWYQLSMDEEFVNKCWLYATPVVIGGRPGLWSAELKAFLMPVPKVLPPEVREEADEREETPGPGTS